MYPGSMVIPHTDDDIKVDFTGIDVLNHTFIESCEQLVTLYSWCNFIPIILNICIQMLQKMGRR